MSTQRLRLEFDDLVVAARTVWGEARGEAFGGKVAVACVIANRALRPGRTWWGDTVTEVCRAKWQFSCWNEDDPNRPKMLMEPANSPAMVDCIGAVLHATQIAGGAADPVKGACHYHVHDMRARPKWAEGREPDVIIGAHAFYIGVD